MSRQSLIIIIAVVIGLLSLGFIAMSNNGPSEAMPQTKKAITTPYTLKDVAKHSSASDCWTAINGSVYDVTDYVTKHPGGDQILNGCGKDASSLFNHRRDSKGNTYGTGLPHSDSARAILKTYKIGVLSKNP